MAKRNIIELLRGNHTPESETIEVEGVEVTISKGVNYDGDRSFRYLVVRGVFFNKKDGRKQVVYVWMRAGDNNNNIRWKQLINEIKERVSNLNPRTGFGISHRTRLGEVFTFLKDSLPPLREQLLKANFPKELIQTITPDWLEQAIRNGTNK